MLLLQLLLNSMLYSSTFFISFQMTFFDRSGRWGYTVNLDSQHMVKCLDTEHGLQTGPGGVYHNTVSQCNSVRAMYIREGQVISIWSRYPGRRIRTDSDLSFWGLVLMP